jgi:peptidoglycan/xylan/chitin deacetylase (PgdA/CDA1 family)
VAKGDGKDSPGISSGAWVLVAVGALAGVAAGAAWGAYDPTSPLFGPVIGKGPRERVAYLTFDDGPNPGVTERILEILEVEGIGATFFMVGSYVARFPECAAAVARAGHEIGNHTYSHVKLHRIGPRRTTDEIRQAHEAIVWATGATPRSFRAPHGYRGPFVARAIAPFGYQTFAWSFGVWDSARPGADRIRRRVRERLRPGSIILLHDGDGYQLRGDRRQTADALPGIIADIRQAGYRLESLSTLALG